MVSDKTKWAGRFLLVGTAMISLEMYIFFGHVEINTTLNHAAVYSAYAGSVLIAIAAVACILSALAHKSSGKAEGADKSLGIAKKLMLIGGAMAIAGLAHIAFPGFAIPGPGFMPDALIGGVIIGSALIAIGFAFSLLGGVQAAFEKGGPTKGEKPEPTPAPT